MAYVTLEYYLNDFHGEPVQETDFPSIAERAAEIIEELCMYRIQENNMDSYSPDIKECRDTLCIAENGRNIQKPYWNY